MKRLLAPLLLFSAFSLQAQLLSPDDFLPHRLGEHFTPHHLLVDYFEHAAANSDRIKLQPYGRTNEDRPLMVAYISTPANLARLESIRLRHLQQLGIGNGDAGAPQDDILIVWLSHSVHGNEAAGSESSMATLYELLRPGNTAAAAWLEKTIVVIDPSINPDGYNRYSNWHRQAANKYSNPLAETREHQEPWPGGRTNHYYFDLNRDWAWQTQVESRQRIPLYKQWLPHVHVDFHEQGVDAPYYFAPAAQPYHAYMTPWQSEFQMEIGRNNMKHFDQEGWLYFTREVFDLLYPSYGDTYPMYHGAIGMTYEQGGSGRAGRGIINEANDTLTLLDRITHHKTTALSTIEVSVNGAARLINNLKSFYQRSSTNPPGPYKTYILKKDNAPGKMQALATLLDRNSIQYGHVASKKSLRAYDYATQKEVSVEVDPGDLVVSAYQPFGTFAQILLDPQTTVVDSVTYDITAWSLPYAYGLTAFAAKEKIELQAGWSLPAVAKVAMQQPYAYLVRWNSLREAKLLAALSQAGIVSRYAKEPFKVEGQDFAAGTLVITRGDNRKMGEAFFATVEGLSRETGTPVIPVRTGGVEKGKDFGSSAYPVANSPSVAIVGGEGTFSNSFGQLWYYFEEDLDYPLTVIESEQIRRVLNDHYNLLVLTDGSYRLDQGTLDAIGQWVSSGGRLILVGAALRAFEGKSGYQLAAYASDEEKKEQEKAAEKARLAGRTDVYGENERNSISGQIPGAIFKVTMDDTHPLAFGLGKTYYSLKTGEASYPLLKDAWNVGRLEEQLMVMGFAGHEIREKMKNNAIFAVQEKGRGSIVYMVDNPLFRAFWENGKLLFANAVFFGE